MKLEIPGGKLCLLRLDAVDDAQLARWETWLDPEKRARIGRQDAQHRRQTVCADALARLMLVGPGATAPQALRFARSASGRPSCPVLPLSFSLSHSGGYAACAVSARPVGVDLEEIRPLRPALLGILSEEERQFLVDATLRNGGSVSYKDNGDGTKSPYELNINYQDALASPEDDDQTRIARFIAAEAILLSLQGMPAIYIHSLLGSRNDYYGRSVSGIPRRINREKLEADFVERALGSHGNRQQIFDELIRRLRLRGEHPAFSPEAAQKVMKLDPRVFALERTAADEAVTVLINVSGEDVTLEGAFAGRDLLGDAPTGHTVRLHPYQCLWILQ